MQIGAADQAAQIRSDAMRGIVDIQLGCPLLRHFFLINISTVSRQLRNTFVNKALAGFGNDAQRILRQQIGTGGAGRNDIRNSKHHILITGPQAHLFGQAGIILAADHRQMRACQGVA